jgi:pyridoxal phosphate-dependent aminotransferase EpsN
MTTSGGGMLVSTDADVIARARFLSTQARDPAPHYQHSTIGYNYRLSNLLAAVGRAQLHRLAEMMERRRQINERYRAAFAAQPGVTFMPVAAHGTPNHWLTVIQIDPAVAGATREDVRLALEAEDIEARPVWKPMHLQPVFSEARCFGGDVAAGLFDRGLCLPSGSNLKEDDQQRVVDIVIRTLRAVPV